MKRSTGAKRRVVGHAGKFGMKGPMARQHPAGIDTPDMSRKTKGRMHWDAKAQ